jgi:hypothetical protein
MTTLTRPRQRLTRCQKNRAKESPAIEMPAAYLMMEEVP